MTFLNVFFEKNIFLSAFSCFKCFFLTYKSNKRDKNCASARIFGCFLFFIKIGNQLFCAKMSPHFIGMFCVDDCPEDKNRSYIITPKA
jgi:hypothetical protein